MTRFGLAGLMALPLLLAHAGAANAQYPFPSRHGCAGCMAFGARMHQHGPLYDYSSLYGYGGGGYGQGGGGCGPWGCFGLNRAPMSRGGFGGGCGSCGLFHRGSCGGGLFSGGLLNGGLFHRGNDCDSCGGGWGRYAVSTFRNVFHRCHPLASRCGHSCGVSTGTSGGCTTCGATTATPVVTANPAPATLPTK